MKAFTDIQQSKKLAEFLPLESADMCYCNDGTSIKIDATSYSVDVTKWKKYLVELIPCWSLASLLNVMPSVTLDSSDNHHYRLFCKERFSEWHDNPIDACVAMIEKLNELKIL